MIVASFQEVWKTYRMGDTEVHALQGIDLEIRQGEYLAIMGASGSGKSTMLNLLGCLDRPSTGRYLLGERNVSELNDDELSTIRGKEIGFVFQSYNLIAQLTVVENIEVPLYYQGWNERESYVRAVELAKLLGLSNRLEHRPPQLSGGQQQRVAIARALANDPLILLADEPTGNLDSATGKEILQLLDDLHARGRTIIMVTHDENVARHSDRIVVLADGRVAAEKRGGK